jgi:hypothetical protein
VSAFVVVPILSAGILLEKHAGGVIHLPKETIQHQLAFLKFYS